MPKISNYTGFVDAVADYGLSTAGTGTANTTALNNAILAAKAASKGVMIGPGIFQLGGTVNLDPLVPIKGLNRRNTQLQSTQAVPMFSYSSTAFGSSVPLLEGLWLNGLNIGTIGLQLNSQMLWRIRDCYMKQFQKAIYTQGSLMGAVEDCFFNENVVAIRGESATTSEGIMRSNLVIFDKCYFQRNTQHAVEWDDGCSIQFRSCDFEINGTNGNSATGTIKHSNTIGGEGIGLIIDKCWFEQSFGGYYLDLGSSNARTTIQSTTFINLPTPTVINRAKLLVIGSKVPVINTDGSGKTTKVIDSDVSSHTETNGATYAVIS